MVFIYTSNYKKRMICELTQLNIVLLQHLGLSTSLAEDSMHVSFIIIITSWNEAFNMAFWDEMLLFTLLLWFSHVLDVHTIWAFGLFCFVCLEQDVHVNLVADEYFIMLLFNGSYLHLQSDSEKSCWLSLL